MQVFSSFPIVVLCLLFFCSSTATQAQTSSSSNRKPWKVPTKDLIKYADSQTDSALVLMWSKRRVQTGLVGGLYAGLTFLNLVTDGIEPALTYTRVNGNRVTQISIAPISLGLGITWIVLTAKFTRKKLYLHMTGERLIPEATVQKAIQIQARKEDKASR